MTKKRLIILIIVAVVVIGAAVGAFFLWRQTQTTPEATSQQPAGTSTMLTQKQTSLRDDVVATLQTEGYQQASEQLDQELQAATEPTDQAYIYTLKMSVATAQSNPDYQLALDYAIKADDASPTYETALNAGSIADLLNQKETAIKYYQLYLDRSVTADGTQLDPAARPYYENRLAELKG